MYAVVNTGGKQAKVEEGSIIAIERLNAEVGDTVTLPVLMLADGDTVLALPAEVAGVTVTAEVLEHFKGDKQIVFKFKKRKGYKRTKGHRQTLTSVRILSIVAGDAPAKPKAAKAKAEKPVAKEQTAAPAPKSKKEPVAAVEATPAAEAASTEPGMCAATKSDGTPCANKAKEGSKYCGVHAKKFEG